MPSDAIVHFDDHTDSVYCVGVLEQPEEGGSILFVSGDGRDKALLWTVDTKSPTEEPEATPTVTKEEVKENATINTESQDKLKTFKLAELDGHTETVEFAKFDSSSRWLVTGGMNNQMRVWDVVNSFQLKHTIEDVPVEDMCFVEWHP